MSHDYNSDNWKSRMECCTCENMCDADDLSFDGECPECEDVKCKMCESWEKRVRITQHPRFGEICRECVKEIERPNTYYAKQNDTSRRRKLDYAGLHRLAGIR